MGITSRGTENVSPAVETIKINLMEFKEAMGAGKAVSEETGVGMQSRMLSNIKLLFRLNDEDFAAGMTLMIDWVKENIKGVMAPEARYRYLHIAKRISRNDQSVMLMVIGLMCMIADPAVREQVLGRFDFSRIDRLWPNVDGGGDKLRNYFAAR